MKSFILILIEVQFVFNKNINDMRHGGEYALHQQPQVAIENSLKLLSQQKSTFNNIQEKGASLWPLGIVTYYFDNESYDSIIAKRLRSVMTNIESESCVQFNSVSSKPINISWLHITNPYRVRACVHQTKSGDEGEIVTVLGYDCLRDSELMHTILHAIGLKDEVTHPQRDRFIRVQWGNIRPEYRQLYRIQSQGLSTIAEYDPLSIMQFHDRAFSSNGQATIVPLLSGLMISPSQRLSQLDTMKLRILFEHECNKRKVSDLIDSCKVSFHTNLKDTMSNKLDNSSNDNIDPSSTSIEAENEVLNAESISSENQDEDISQNELQDSNDRNQDDDNTDGKQQNNSEENQSAQISENDNNITHLDNDDEDKNMSLNASEDEDNVSAQQEPQNQDMESIHLKPLNDNEGSYN